MILHQLRRGVNKALVTTKLLREAYSHVEAAMAMLEKMNLNMEHGTNTMIPNAHGCYREVYHRKTRTANESTLKMFFQKHIKLVYIFQKAIQRSLSKFHDSDGPAKVIPSHFLAVIPPPPVKKRIF